MNYGTVTSSKTCVIGVLEEAKKELRGRGRQCMRKIEKETMIKIFQISCRIQAHRSKIQQAPSKINKVTSMPILNIAN